MTAATQFLTRWQDQDDSEALESLLRTEMRRLQHRIHHHGRHMLRRGESVRDIAQEVCFRFLRRDNAARFPNSSALRQYLWQAAWRLLVDQLRSAGRVAFLIDNASETDLVGSGGLGDVERSEARLALQVAINLLDECDREILRLVYFEALTIEQAAEQLGIARGAANMRLVRARRSLASKLGRCGEMIDV